MAVSTRSSRSSGSTSKSARSVRKSLRVCSVSVGVSSPFSAPRLKGFSSSRRRPTRCDCQASGRRRSLDSAASSFHSRPNVSATVAGSGRQPVAKSPRSVKKSCAADDAKTPRSTANPRARRSSLFSSVPSILGGTIAPTWRHAMCRCRFGKAAAPTGIASGIDLASMRQRKTTEHNIASLRVHRYTLPVSGNVTLVPNDRRDGRKSRGF